MKNLCKIVLICNELLEIDPDGINLQFVPHYNEIGKYFTANDFYSDDTSISGMINIINSSFLYRTGPNPVLNMKLNLILHKNRIYIIST